MRLFVPLDSAAKALGADEVAAALLREARARGIEIELVRTGTRGMIWLEPLVEVETDAGPCGIWRGTCPGMQAICWTGGCRAWGLWKSWTG